MSRKQDVRERVKEIKQRQQNWLKQRAESQHVSESFTNSSPHATADDKDSSFGGSAASKPFGKLSPGGNDRHYNSNSKDQSLAQSLITSNKSRAKFQNWLKSKQPDTDENEDMNYEERYVADSGGGRNREQYNSNLYTDKPYRDHKGSGDVNVLQVPSNRSSGFASPDPSWNSDDETGEITAATLLSPEDFDARADDIIAKVKGEMAMKNVKQGRNSPRPLNYGYHSVASKPPEQEPYSQLSDRELSSHVCPTCDKLMMPPNASPMLLIPCGHTQCSCCCSKTKFCAMCGCPVQSSTLNIMLKQIITNFHTKQLHRKSAQKSASRHKVQNNYKEEYQNLTTRKEILEEERENIARNLEKLTGKLKKDQQQMSSIQNKEADIEKEIQELQRKLTALQEHRQEYEKQCYNLEVQTKQEKNRLILVQDSLTTIDQQIEKVQLLAEEEY